MVTIIFSLLLFLFFIDKATRKGFKPSDQQLHNVGLDVLRQTNGNFESLTVKTDYHNDENAKSITCVTFRWTITECFFFNHYCEVTGIIHTNEYNQVVKFQSFNTNA
ncbi:MAG TPA: hypothetical protein PKD56_09250, partial [Chitinophagales bacterium]|nr:hypothetical protein [Chitinophagales bacterium]